MYCQVIAIIEQLKSAGFSNNSISALLPDKSGTKDFAYEHHTKAPDGATTGGVAGGVVGGALGWLVGIGALAIPGVGPFIAAGPIMAALSGAAVGGAVGGVAGALIGMGIPEYEAKRYEAKVKGVGTSFYLCIRKIQTMLNGPRKYLSVPAPWTISSTDESTPFEK